MDDSGLQHIGRKMPYTVSDTFFDRMEQNILAETCGTQPRRKTIKIKRWLTTAAASVAIALTVTSYLMSESVASPDFDDVAQAFDNMSDDDQRYIIDTYQQDIFINYHTN